MTMLGRMVVAVGVVTLLAGVVQAVPQLGVTLGTRETGMIVPIGSNGGAAGNIEWVDLNGQTLVLDGTWQQFSFDLANANANGTVTAWIGNGVLDGTMGVLEQIRFQSDGSVGPITLWIDDIVDTVTTGPVLINSFAGFADGQEVAFRPPRYSPSTSANLAADPNVAGVDNTLGYTDSSSLKVEFQWLDSDPSRWLRLTTSSSSLTAEYRNPAISYVDDSVLTFWMRGVPEPATAMLLAVAGGLFLRRRRSV